MTRKKKNKTYGILNVPVKYAIFIASDYAGNIGRFVTEVNYSPKQFRFEYGKCAKFFDSREEAESLASAMCCNLYPAFVMEVPELTEDYYKNFENIKPNEQEG